MVAALLPLPALRGERVGVRGSIVVTGQRGICGDSPSPVIQALLE
jgi:F0F1-type ATP synthase gamma subunit